jgi:serine/threonine protein kinase
MTPGEQLGHYRIIRQIGQGGMGEVFLAEDTRIARQVALKAVRTERTPYPNTAAIQEVARLFQREMRVISQLDHPHILTFYDFGEQPVVGGSIMYMVMPYRPEGSLVEWLAQRSEADLLTPQVVDFLLKQAAAALQYAHNQQIVHQDVKPSNFLVRIDNERPAYPDLFLVDFGIARMMSGTSTASNSVRGTYTYMAPEQWNGQPVPATDQYALAVMAYQLLTGVPPFQGRPEQVMFQHLTERPKPPSSVNPRLSPAIDAVILRALEKDPQQRFPSITMFAAAFHSALSYIELKATLSVTREEAFTGINKTIRLPGGRQVTVTVPPNAQAGQEIILPEQGELYYDAGPRGPLHLTISTGQTTVIPMLGSSGSNLPIYLNPNNKPPEWPTSPPTADKTLAVPPPTPTADKTVAASPATFEKTTIAPPPPPPEPGIILEPVRPTPAKRPRWIVTVLVAVAALLVISGIVAVAVNNTIATNNEHATATAQSIADDNATATAQAIADENATATAVADDLTATAVANAAATATVVAANPDPYSPAGTLALIDPLNQPGEWNDNANTGFGGQCQFTGGVYQVTQIPTDKFYICSSTSTFSNVAFEAQMTIVQGDCGGLVLRESNAHFYRLTVCADGTYQFYRYDGYDASTSHLLVGGSSNAIVTGTGRANLIAVVANGSTFDLYVNNQQVDSASDSTYGSAGTLGLIALSYNQDTTVTYQNARAWTF